MEGTKPNKFAVRCTKCWCDTCTIEVLTGIDWSADVYFSCPVCKNTEEWEVDCGVLSIKENRHARLDQT